MFRCIAEVTASGVLPKAKPDTAWMPFRVSRPHSSMRVPLILFQACVVARERCFTRKRAASASRRGRDFIQCRGVYHFRLPTTSNLFSVHFLNRVPQESLRNAVTSSQDWCDPCSVFSYVFPSLFKPFLCFRIKKMTAKLSP